MTFNRPRKLDPLDLVTREEWEAKPPRWERPIELCPVHHYVVQYAARHSCYRNEPDMLHIMRHLQKNHMADKNCPDIKFNFVVGYDGKVYEGRGWRTQPTLPPKYDKIKELSVLIGWIGLFPHSKTAREIKPPLYVIDTRRNLLHHGIYGKHISHVLRVFFIHQGKINHRAET